MTRDDQNWMWSEAVEMLARAERMHDQFFQPRRAARRPAWSPPVDVIETEREVLILIALPGVAPDQVEASVEDGVPGGFRTPHASARAADRRHSSPRTAAGALRTAHPCARPAGTTASAAPRETVAS